MHILDLISLPDGDLLACGYTLAGQAEKRKQFVLARLHADGSLHSSLEIGDTGDESAQACAYIHGRYMAFGTNEINGIQYGMFISWNPQSAN
jgi:hypothetical protein